jgi:hypothetical protein
MDGRLASVDSAHDLPRDAIALEALEVPLTEESESGDVHAVPEISAFHFAPERVFCRTSAEVDVALIIDGRLEAYLFRGREYRVTRRALEQYQARERHSNDRSNRGV